MTHFGFFARQKLQRFKAHHSSTSFLVLLSLDLQCFPRQHFCLQKSGFLAGFGHRHRSMVWLVLSAAIRLRSSLWTDSLGISEPIMMRILVNDQLMARWPGPAPSWGGSQLCVGQTVQSLHKAQVQGEFPKRFHFSSQPHGQALASVHYLSLACISTHSSLRRSCSQSHSFGRNLMDIWRTLLNQPYISFYCSRSWWIFQQVPS